MSEQRIIVVGAGLSGLAVAARLVSSGREVLLLEASPRAGGQIHTQRDAIALVELGAEGFVARSRAVPALCELLGIESSLVDQLTTDTYAVEAAGLTLLPAGEAARRLGFQVPAEELGRGIRSLTGGMGQLVEALVEHVGPQRLALSRAVNRVGRSADGLYVELGGDERELCQALVLATPARRAAALLEPLLPEASAKLVTAQLMTNVSVNLLYHSAQFRDYPPGSGLIFPSEVAALGLRAVSLVDHKFAGRVSAEHALLRVFFRPIAGSVETWSDERFATEAARAIAGVLPVDGEPGRTWVSRWVDALPIFSPDYRTVASEADSALQAHGIHVAGSAFHGAGIDAAVSSAERVASRLTA